MRLLIIGSNGQVGWEVMRQCAAEDLPHDGKDLPDFDITDPSAVSGTVTDDITMVVNAAAYTAVDKAETDASTANAVNAAGPSYLAAECQRRGIPLIHISTDYVFDGTQKEPYLETDPVSPIGVYGKSKAEGEDAVRSTLPRHIILRTAWLCGVHGQNFVKTMIRLGLERDHLRIVNDQFGCPTFAFDIAEAILTIYKKYRTDSSIAWGTYHYCGAGAATWYEFATEIFQYVRRYVSLNVRNIEPILTEQYPTPAKRPANSVLDCRKIERSLGIRIKPWRPRLRHMIDLLYGNSKSPDARLHPHA